MRAFFLPSLLFLSLLTYALAWTKEDHEIFDIVSALEASEGKGTTFYSLLGVESTASLSEINKAYRRKSLELHPDKNPGVKNIQDRFARLGVINTILKSPEGRERYNFFYKNGVPVWRGTGYYYSRFRPTLTHTIIFLILLTSLLHLLVQKLNYNRDSARVKYFETAAKAAAGKSGAEGKRRRKVRVPMSEGDAGGGMLELVVVGEDVMLPHDDGSLTPLSELASKPAFTRTWPFLVFRSLSKQIIPYLPPSLRPATPEVAAEPESSEDGIPSPTPKPKTKSRAAELRQARQNGTGNGAGAKSTPSSPAATDLDSDATGEDGEELEEVNGDVDAEKKKKKKGLGKSGGMRRRKMGLKG